MKTLKTIMKPTKSQFAFLSPCANNCNTPGLLSPVLAGLHITALNNDYKNQYTDL